MWLFLGTIALVEFGFFNDPEVIFKNKYKKMFILVISGPLGWGCLVDSKIDLTKPITVIDNIVKWFKN
jgi:hypothetical protein